MGIGSTISLLLFSLTLSASDFKAPCDQPGLRTCTDFFTDLESNVLLRFQNASITDANGTTRTIDPSDKEAGLIENYYSGRVYVPDLENADNVNAVTTRTYRVAVPICSIVKNRFTKKTSTDSCSVNEPDESSGLNHRGESCGDWADLKKGGTLLNPQLQVKLYGNYGKRERAYQEGAFIFALAHYFNSLLESGKETKTLSLVTSCAELGIEYDKLLNGDPLNPSTPGFLQLAAKVTDIDTQIAKCTLGSDGGTADSTLDQALYTQSACILKTARKGLETLATRMFTCEVIAKAKSSWGTVMSDFETNSANFDQEVVGPCSQHCTLFSCSESRLVSCYKEKTKTYFEKIYRTNWPNGESCSNSFSSLFFFGLVGIRRKRRLSPNTTKNRRIDGKSHYSNKGKLLLAIITLILFSSCDRAEIIFMQGPCYSLTGGLALNDDQVACCEKVYCGWIEGQIKDNQCQSECANLETHDTGDSDYSFTSSACNTCVDANFEAENERYGTGTCVEWGDLDRQSNFQALAKSTYTEAESDSCPVDLTEDDGTEIIGGQSTLAGIKAALGSANDMISGGTNSTSTGTEELPTATDFAHLETSASTATTSVPTTKKDSATGVSSIELPGLIRSGNSNGTSASGNSSSLTSMGLSQGLPAIVFGTSTDAQLNTSTGDAYKSNGNPSTFTNGTSSYLQSVNGLIGGVQSPVDLNRLPAASNETLIINDPDDYFTRTDVGDSLFKIVERRYRATSLKWKLDQSKVN